MTKQERGMTIVIKSNGDFGFVDLRHIRTARGFGGGVNEASCASLIG
jgi:hypothetical protein